MYKLMISEKPSVAAGLSSVLCVEKREDSFFIGNGYIMSYCFGHLLELAPPNAYGERYVKWRYADLPIVPHDWIHTPLKDKLTQLKILKELMNRVDVECIINACDAGREGNMDYHFLPFRKYSTNLKAALFIRCCHKNQTLFS